MNLNPAISIVIPAFNEELYIGGLLDSLSKQDYPKSLIEVIVVDNNSNDETRNIAKLKGAKVVLQEHGPVGKVRNRGVIESKNDIIFFIDSDCLAPSDWVSTGVRYLVNNGPGYIMGGGYCLREKPYFLERYWLLETPKRKTTPQELVGGAICIYKSDFIKAGMFNTIVTSGEDTKLKNSLEEKGFFINLDKNFSVIHLGNPIKISQFVKRQIWHSENYLSDIKSSLSDPIFWITTVFLISACLGFISIKYSDFLFFPLVSLFCVLTLSLKRIFRTRQFKFLLSIPFVMFVDLLYLLGRSCGLIKSLFKAT